MKFERLSIPDLVLITPRVHEDPRGFFMETWRADLFEKNAGPARFVQDNHSKSSQWTLRGLHYQVRVPQGKLVRAVAGAVFDVAVDLRRSSPHFGKWAGVILSDADKASLWVPGGFAHGFLVLSETAEITYKCTDYYSPRDERTLAWDDPEVGIEWPAPASVEPLLSVKDRAGKRIADLEAYD